VGGVSRTGYLLVGFAQHGGRGARGGAMTAIETRADNVRRNGYLQVGIAQRCEDDISTTTLKMKVSRRRHRSQG